MWPSEANASRIYDIANVALIVALFTGVIATALVVWMGNVKEAYLRTALARLNIQAAQANERAAHAMLELQKYKAPRTLSEQQRAILVESLGAFAGQEFDLSVASGSEPTNLVCALNNVLIESGWVRSALPSGLISVTVNTPCGLIAANAASDVHVRVSSTASRETSAAADILVDALLIAELVAHSGRDDKNIPSRTVVLLMVGIKQ